MQMHTIDCLCCRMPPRKQHAHRFALLMDSQRYTSLSLCLDMHGVSVLHGGAAYDPFIIIIATVTHASQLSGC